MLPARPVLQGTPRADSVECTQTTIADGMEGTMSRLIPITLILLVGCSGNKKLGPEQIALLLESKSGLIAIKLEANREVSEPRHTEYGGTGRDSEGKEYELLVDV